nr:FtsX-like permease family protein [Bradyrhizobium amphicarpaeae]
MIGFRRLALAALIPAGLVARPAGGRGAIPEPGSRRLDKSPFDKPLFDKPCAGPFGVPVPGRERFARSCCDAFTCAVACSQRFAHPDKFALTRSQCLTRPGDTGRDPAPVQTADLAALLVGGVGVANAVKSHIDRKLEVIAAFKAVGATGRDVFGIYLAQVLLLAAIGSAIGLVLGAAMPFAIVGLFGKLLPLPVVPAVHADELALSFLYGLLTALAFGLWPLGRVHDVPVAALTPAESSARQAIHVVVGAADAS